MNGREYRGWKTARVTRSLESVCRSFELSVFDRWAEGGKPWPIIEEDECTVLLGDEQVLTGYVDKRNVSIGPESHSLTVSGRDRTGALVDCSADGYKLELANASVLKLAKKLCDPFLVRVRMQEGLAEPSTEVRIAIDVGESAFSALERACRMAALLPVSDGDGGVVLSRVGSARATDDLVEGENILEASGDYDGSARFASYQVVGQFPGGRKASSSGTAIDGGVRRQERALVLRAEAASTTTQAKLRAAWEATVRAGRAHSVTVVVQGWTQRDGALWPLGALVHVKSLGLGLDADMVIAGTAFSMDDGGTKTTLSLRRPDAFAPEYFVPDGPKPRRERTSPWDEIAKGV